MWCPHTDYAPILLDWSIIISSVLILLKMVYISISNVNCSLLAYRRALDLLIPLIYFNSFFCRFLWVFLLRQLSCLWIKTVFFIFKLYLLFISPPIIALPTVTNKSSYWGPWCLALILGRKHSVFHQYMLAVGILYIYFIRLRKTSFIAWILNCANFFFCI